jgi:hypothetical protein
MVIWDHDIVDKISKKKFAKRIKNFKEKDIDITYHALFRLNQKQRKIYEDKVLKDIISNQEPIEIGKQDNGNMAVIYYYKDNKIIKILMKLRPNKIYIVTFYILNKRQREKIGK